MWLTTVTSSHSFCVTWHENVTVRRAKRQAGWYSSGLRRTQSTHKPAGSLHDKHDLRIWQELQNTAPVYLFSLLATMWMDRRRRASLALTLNFVALILAIFALTTSYWCDGNRKVVKPFCTGPVTGKQTHCIRYNSSNINDSRLVQYIWETGEDKFVLRKFHTGIWFSCEQNVDLIGKNMTLSLLS